MKKSKLVGKFFHSFKDKEINWQGEIISEESEGLLLVQFFNWFDGDLSNQKLVQVLEMKDWKFYNSSKDMIYAYKQQERTRVKELKKYGGKVAKTNKTKL